MASISGNKSDVGNIVTIVFKISRMAIRAISLNKLSYIEIMIFAINIFFKIMGKNNVRVFNIKMKFNLIIVRGHKHSPLLFRVESEDLMQ